MMLKINNHTINKYKVPLSLLLIACCSLTLFSYLTFIPTYSSAADITSDQRTLMNIKYMQQMSEQICTNTKENKTKQLIDIRDGKSYWIAKLKDGNCWMTQNFAHNGGGVVRVFDAASNQCDGWENDNNIDQYCAASHTNGDHNSLGNYYSWSAAMNGDTSATGAVQGICPNNWHLPTSNSFYNLATAYNADNNSAGSIIMRSEPLYFQYGGAVNAGGAGAHINGADYYGFYWSSNPNTSTDAYHLFLTNSNVITSSGVDARAQGCSVRCLAPGTGLDGNGNADETVWDDPDYPDLLDINQANLAITVSPVISIDATSGMSSAVDFTTVALGDIKATVSSNQAYQVLLSTNQSTLEQDPSVANQNIPMVEQDTPITAGTRAWGIRKTNSVLPGGILGDSSTNTTLYSPIGINNDKILFYQSLGAESKTLIFPVAISVDSTLPSGVYSTMVTITAVGN